MIVYENVFRSSTLCDLPFASDCHPDLVAQPCEQNQATSHRSVDKIPMSLGSLCHCFVRFTLVQFVSCLFQCISSCFRNENHVVTNCGCGSMWIEPASMESQPVPYLYCVRGCCLRKSSSCDSSTRSQIRLHNTNHQSSQFLLAIDCPIRYSAYVALVGKAAEQDAKDEMIWSKRLPSVSLKVNLLPTHKR